MEIPAAATPDASPNMAAAQHMVAVEPHVDMLQRDERPDEERGADDEDEGDGDLGDNEDRAHPA